MSLDLELFYGGAAGGGKTEALLMAALQFVELPDYHALLLRRTYSELALEDSLMNRAFKWLSGKAIWHAKTYTWIFPSGATLTFGYLETERDKYRYQSSAYQFIGFDELTEFTESQYLFLFSRLRRKKGSNIPLRMRAASNPGGIGHDWVKRRFIDTGKYVLATLEDNPYIDKQAYEQSLSKLDYVTRRQLRYGDWSIKSEGALFRREWFEIVEDVPTDLKKVRYWDLAATKSDKSDWTAGVLLGVKNGIYYVIDVRRIRGTPLEVESLIRQTAMIDGVEVPIYIEQESGASGVTLIDYYRRKVLPGFIVIADKKTSSKIDRAKPVSAAAEAGNIKLLKGKWIKDFLDEIEVFPLGEHDDQVDALSGAFMALSFGRRARVL